MITVKNSEEATAQHSYQHALLSQHFFQELQECSSRQDTLQGSWISLWFKFTFGTWLLSQLIHYFNPLRDLNLFIYSSMYLPMADVCRMGWTADRCICTHIPRYPSRKIIPDWGWLDEKIPQHHQQAAWGWEPAGQEENKPSWAATWGRAGRADSQRTWIVPHGRTKQKDSQRLKEDWRSPSLWQTHIF